MRSENRLSRRNPILLLAGVLLLVTYLALLETCPVLTEMITSTLSMGTLSFQWFGMFAVLG